MDSVELFTGCGGLALGLSRAGFRSLRMSEWDKHSVANVEHNRRAGVQPVADWPIYREDVRSVDWSQFGGVDLVAGGPPCQPFSVGGKHKGQLDPRDMWPEAIRAVRESQPRAFLFENVRGILRPAFKDYLDWILHSLSKPGVEIKQDESREDHLRRLSKAKTLYRVRMFPVNAANYGAAQKRHRIIILGIHEDLDVWPELLPQTHSLERLLWDKWVTGVYWSSHGLKKPKVIPLSEARVVDRLLNASLIPPQSKPWVTVRDVLRGLGAPDTRADLSNHNLQSGARSYPGHTGSLLDEPAKALKAGVHGVPGGENTLAYANGKVRYFTVREAARLQGMPDDFEFIGSWSENMRQLGNAVPSQLSEAFGSYVRNLVATKRNRKSRAA